MLVANPECLAPFFEERKCLQFIHEMIKGYCAIFPYWQSASFGYSHMFNVIDFQIYFFSEKAFL